MKIDEVILTGAEILKSHGIPDSFLNAELLVAHTLGIERKELYIRTDDELSPEKIERFYFFLQKRINFQPLQYITGEAEFYGRRFIVTQDVLIPRPETELMIDEVKKYYVDSKNFSILDIGTGSGNIAITLKKEFPSAMIFATDISYSAIRIAQLNSKKHGLRDGFFLFCSDLFSAFKLHNRFDVIIANPPYIPTERIKLLQPEISLYEPVEAIDGGPDGMDKIKEIISCAWHYLKKGGKLIIEIDETQAGSVLTFVEKANNYKDAELKKDLAGLDRFLVTTRE